MAALSTQVEKARAKINLTLRVGSVDPDGYHALQSLVVFADIGDFVGMAPASYAEQSKLTISGPFGNDLPNDRSNLILRTADLTTNPSHKKSLFHLVKNLPVASGIGGGSADAAATARLLYGGDHANKNQDALLLLGADIPVCLASNTCIMEGRGERITPLPGLGPLYAVLANPGVDISTGLAIGMGTDRVDHHPDLGSNHSGT